MVSMTAYPLSSPTRYQSCVWFNSGYRTIFFLSSLQLRGLLGSTMAGYSSLFSPDDATRLPVFRMQLCLDEEAIQFFPSLEDLEAAVMFPLNSLASDVLQSFPLIQVDCVDRAIGRQCVDPSLDWTTN